MTSPTTKPTTFRISKSQIEKLDEIHSSVKLTRNSLVCLAIDAFLDHVERTGKLPVPKLRRKKN